MYIFIVICSPCAQILTIFLFYSFFFLFILDNKSILTDSDWKKLWMEAGNANPSSKTDNTIDSSDSPAFDDTEVRFLSILVIIVSGF